MVPNLQQTLITQALVNTGAILELQQQLAQAQGEIVRLRAALDHATKAAVDLATSPSDDEVGSRS